MNCKIYQKLAKFAEMKNFGKYIFIAVFLLLSDVLTFAQTDSPFLDRVVIDPGHGGMDSGGVSKDKKTYEKNLVLYIGKALRDLIKKEYGDDVSVWMTRESDVFIPLQDRADFANKHHADLFISVHINANFKTAPSGHSVHILGASSDPNRDLVAGQLDVVKRENSVILLENDYNTRYQGFDPNDDASTIFMTLMQSAFYEQSILFASMVEEQLEKGPIRVRRGVEQNPFYVLWKTTMPAVLLELGFITNDEDLAHLRNNSDLDMLAQRVFDAFVQYKKSYDISMLVMNK